MKKIILLLLLTLSLFAELKHAFATQELIDSKIKIIDIRTPPEWKETGLLKGSIPIVFFDERGNYDIKAFLAKLNTHVKHNEKFALICRTGSRTVPVSDFLSKQGYDVINLRGGILYAIGNRLQIEPYTSR